MVTLELAEDILADQGLLRADFSEQPVKRVRLRKRVSRISRTKLSELRSIVRCARHARIAA